MQQGFVQQGQAGGAPDAHHSCHVWGLWRGCSTASQLLIAFLHVELLPFCMWVSPTLRPT